MSYTSPSSVNMQHITTPIGNVPGDDDKLDSTSYTDSDAERVDKVVAQLPISNVGESAASDQGIYIYILMNIEKISMCTNMHVYDRYRQVNNQT